MVAHPRRSCVFRMNRAPTKGFEADVGTRTTLDWVNSFPHLRSPSILPRLDTTLLHGSTVEYYEHTVRPPDPDLPAVPPARPHPQDPTRKAPPARPTHNLQVLMPLSSDASLGDPLPLAPRHRAGQSQLRTDGRFWLR